MNKPQSLSGQPNVTGAVRRILRRHALAVLNDPDPGKARTSLLIALEPVAHCDVVDLLADTLAEDSIYRGFTSILAEIAEDDPDVDRRRYARFNLARAHLAKASLLTNLAARRNLVAQANSVLRQPGKPDRDPAWVELESEIALLQGRVDDALAIASRLAALTGNPALAACRLGEIQRRGGRLDAATETLEAALKKTSDRRVWKHRLLQRLASVEFDRGRKDAALRLLMESAKVEQDRDSPFALETALARRLLPNANRSVLAAYAAAAAAHFPGDPDAESLSRQVNQGNG
ncbi:MAG: tetratricopeptide repeat protein [Armatimonadaceae bacterium]